MGTSYMRHRRCVLRYQNGSHFCLQCDQTRPRPDVVKRAEAALQTGLGALGVAPWWHLGDKSLAVVALRLACSLFLTTDGRAVT